jgi:predicted Zn-ribbon and HTH transcriptional regulator
MSAVLYARVSQELKDAVEQRAVERGASLTATVTDLIERGLTAIDVADTRPALEASNHDLVAELARVRDTASTLEERMRQVLGTCRCGSELTGRDLLVTGHCPNCKAGISSLLAGGEITGASVNRSELGPFMSGVGVALALLLLAYAATRE